MLGEMLAGSLTSSFKLLIWVPALLSRSHYFNFCTSIIDSLKDNRSLFILGVMEKFKQNFPVAYKYQWAFYQKSHPLDEHGRDYEFFKEGACEKLIYSRYT